MNPKGRALKSTKSARSDWPHDKATLPILSRCAATGSVAANPIDSRSTISREPSGSLEHVSMACYAGAKTIVCPIIKSYGENKNYYHTPFDYLSRENACYFAFEQEGIILNFIKHSINIK